MEGPLNNSPEWYELRGKLITSSQFKRILADMAKDMSFGPGAMTYALEIASYMLTGEAPPNVDTEETRWGIEHEDAAAARYEEAQFVTTLPGRLVTKQGTMIGSSPDRFVGENGLLEIKCPKSSTHLATLLRKQMPPIHLPQVQGQLWVTGREWVDFVSYDPRFKDPALQLFIQRIPRNESYIVKMSLTIMRFQDLVLEYAAAGQESKHSA